MGGFFKFTTMKTAMAFALARIEMLYIEKDSVHWEMFKNRCMEKEKEHIINAFEVGYKSCDIDEAFEIDRKLASGEKYYNKTYQNK